MFNRRRTSATSDAGDRGAVATTAQPADRTATAEPVAPATDRDERFATRERDGRYAGERDGGIVAPATMSAVREHQRDRFGGFSWGADFFGWLAAAGLTAILAGIVGGAGAALGLTKDSAETIGLSGAIALLVVLFLAYTAGGYVAGRMARFDGARQGIGVWLWGIIIAAAVAALAAIAGSKYNVLDQLNLPRIPIDQGTLTKGGAITLAAALIVSLLGAIFGGTLGARWHRRVDRAAVDGI
jgi:hypothetical protein